MTETWRRKSDDMVKSQKDRVAILKEIRKIVGDSSEDGRVQQPMIFCIADGELLPDAQFWQITYRHAGHNGDRG